MRPSELTTQMEPSAPEPPESSHTLRGGSSARRTHGRGTQRIASAAGGSSVAVHTMPSAACPSGGTPSHA
eukprot:CAMPEP_0185306162 /NCGR_PEP_ID=MMETSP1363-20130426/15905_1 /TAXON_ID=38817 /ORGANISM="Gephyrocapsa oceanica, Strain RCC1303" /LENGTH=69 /DNA_ID=CAMNT_0027903433 /DNA_START=503 /DNA_END=712 /DNA_ORIENTATION=+